MTPGATIVWGVVLFMALAFIALVSRDNRPPGPHPSSSDAQ